MPAAAADGQRVPGVGLFGGLHGEARGRSVRLVGTAPAVRVEAELRMAEQVEPLGRALLRADAVGFFVAGKENNNIARRLESGGLEVDQRLDDGGITVLHVDGPAAVIIAV